MEEREVENIREVFARIRTLEPEGCVRYAPTDVGRAFLFGDLYEKKLRYVPERKSWYVYDGVCWQQDVQGLMAMELCKDFAEALYVYYSMLLDPKADYKNGSKNELVKDADKLRKRHARETVLKDAQGVITARISEFDRNPYLFNCKNGTLDLRTRCFTEHFPEDMISIVADVEYNPGIRSELWEETVREVMKGNEELEKYLQKALGYGLSGDTSEECFFLLYGPTTRNGKGTIMETYMRMLGGYGRAARPETIAMRQYVNSSGPTEDIAKLCGARAVNISEPDKQLVLSAATVKSLTGNDTMTARFLNENSFEFRPQFKLFINTNHLPKANDMTIFSSGRVKVLPFDRHFSSEEQDKTLKRRLCYELTGVLNWCVEGYRLMREEGFEAPDSVQEATAQYRRDSDKLARFVEDCLESDFLGEEPVQEVYSVYRRWCEKNGQKADGYPTFKQGIQGYGQVVRKRLESASGYSNRLTVLTGFKMK